MSLSNVKLVAKLEEHMLFGSLFVEHEPMRFVRIFLSIRWHIGNKLIDYKLRALAYFQAFDFHFDHHL